MADYQHVWGPSQKKWCPVDFRERNILTVLIVGAWIGMVLFFAVAAFALITRSNGATIAMLLSLAIWLACGISAIRIRRGRRKFLRVLD